MNTVGKLSFATPLPPLLYVIDLKSDKYYRGNYYGKQLLPLLDTKTIKKAL